MLKTASNAALRLRIGKARAVHVAEEYLDGAGNILWDKMNLL